MLVARQVYALAVGDMIGGTCARPARVLALQAVNNVVDLIIMSHATLDTYTSIVTAREAFIEVKLD
jgi:hypothetical protein